ncbi:MAG: PAS domain-containing protein [Sphingobacteriaceae bacterium]
MTTGKLTTQTIDHLIEGFQAINFDWEYIYVNKAIVKQSKYNKKEDLLGFTMMEKYPGIEHSDMFKILQFCMKERESACFENEFTFPDQSTAYFELRVQPIPEGLFILSIDVTARKRVAEERNKFIKGLEEMLFMTSLKVQQPASNILGLSDLLEDEALDQVELKEICDFMKESAIQLDEFTKELTTFIHQLKKH